MKQARDLRSLEELWALEDKHPLVGSNPAGLMRWMYATGMLNSGSRHKPSRSRVAVASLRNGKKTRR